MLERNMVVRFFCHFLQTSSDRVPSVKKDQPLTYSTHMLHLNLKSPISEFSSSTYKNVDNFTNIFFSHSVKRRHLMVFHSFGIAVKVWEQDSITPVRTFFISSGSQIKKILHNLTKYIFYVCVLYCIIIRVKLR